MKKKYQKPTTKVFYLGNKPVLLVGSGKEAGDGYVPVGPGSGSPDGGL